MTRTTLTGAERAIYRRYAGLALPRHTSYPIAPAWRGDYTAGDFRTALSESAQRRRPLSLYVHVPFCERLCYYCACTKEIVPASKKLATDPGRSFLVGLETEAARLGEIVGMSPVDQVHLGGGSPTFLRPEQLRRLWQTLTAHFTIAPNAEIAVEIDPRIPTFEHLSALRELGFNRVSLGIQDFTATVQRAVNRMQSVETVERVVSWCRELGFASINFDLIYGLPFQTLESMGETLEQTIALAPDRIAFYRLAVIPEIFRWQNVFHAEDLPAGDPPLELNLLAIQRFQDAGYEFIGLDHFARPTEALARAWREQSLHRNFQGMTTGKELDVVGLGPSAISQLDSAFAQNHKMSADWQAALERGLATERGLRLSVDDRLRRELMQQLYGYGIIRKASLEQRFHVAFDSYFAGELDGLRSLIDEGLVEMDDNDIRLTDPLGRLLVRVVAAVFDAYLPAGTFRSGLAEHLSSKVG
ncbi:MAG: oxygen-independent coproporphyrinogen III oxidase [Planctomycetes bacterium]|nr:oxygen-independent coproporphyrinogen III oxidase [Planctomycetota bacterium]